MKKIIFFFLNKTFGKKKYFRFYTILRNISLQGLNYKNVDINSNGELYLMEEIKKNFTSIDPVVFDVGANNGSYSLKLSEVFNNKCKIHAFEPYSKAFLQLTQATKTSTVIKIYPIGFGDVAQKVEFYSDPVYSELGGIYKRDFSKLDIYLEDKENVTIDTLDNFCSENKIDKIDFLKIDVEGFELNILKGAKALLSNNKIGLIQFEYGAGNYLSKTYLYDFFQLLSAQYNIYKLMKDGLSEIKEYNSDYEIHTICYYVAINKKLNFQ